MRTVAIVTSLALGALAWPAEAAPAKLPLRRDCRFQYDDGRVGWTEAEARKTIVCAFAHFAPGETDEAMAIAARESNFQATAVNRYSGAAGLFQHLPRYWDGRVRAFGRRYWFPWTWPNVPILSARANAIITARMVAAAGWGPWS